MMKRFFCSGLLLAALACSAEVLIEANAPEDFIKRPVATADADGNILGKRGGVYTSKKAILVDAQKKYRLSVEFKNGDENTKNVIGALVAIPYDAKGVRLKGEWISHFPGSETKIAEAVEKGDTTIILEPNKTWQARIRKYPKRSYSVVFNALKNRKDIPNRSSIRIKSQKINEDGRIILTLSGKLPKAYAAGTLVRLHSIGWVGVGSMLKATNEWQTKTIEISKMSYQATAKHWWRTTRKARIAVFASGANGKGEVLLFRNLKIEEI